MSSPQHHLHLCRRITAGELIASRATITGVQAGIRIVVWASRALTLLSGAQSPLPPLQRQLLPLLLCEELGLQVHTSISKTAKLCPSMLPLRCFNDSTANFMPLSACSSDVLETTQWQHNLHQCMRAAETYTLAKSSCSAFLFLSSSSSDSGCVCTDTNQNKLYKLLIASAENWLEGAKMST